MTDRPPVSGAHRDYAGRTCSTGLMHSHPRPPVSGEPSTAIYLNDRPYSDGEEDPFRSLADTLAFSVDDWGHTRAMAWVWGIINGWDDEAMAELAEQHGWDEDTTARLNRLHAAFEARATPPSLDEAVRLLRLFVANEDSPCRFDHHGYCQEHHLEEVCTVEATRQFLARLTSDDREEKG